MSLNSPMTALPRFTLLLNLFGKILETPEYKTFRACSKINSSLLKEIDQFSFSSTTPTVSDINIGAALILGLHITLNPHFHVFLDS